MNKPATLLSAAAVVALSAVSHGDELWRQDHANCAIVASQCYGGPASQQARNAGGPGWMYETVDNFDAEAGWTVTSLEFWGGQATLTPAVTDGFMIRFYNDNNGQVGPLISTQDVFTYTKETYFTWIPAFPLEGYHYTLDLVQPFVPTAAGRYWMSIVAIQSFGGPNDRQWFWNVADGVRGPTCVQSTSPPGNYNPEPYDVPFVLIGTPGSQPCYPDCNADGQLNLSDFGCFQTRFALGDPYADCNGDGVRNLSDFGCFQTKFALGCP